MSIGTEVGWLALSVWLQAAGSAAAPVANADVSPLSLKAMSTMRGATFRYVEDVATDSDVKGALYAYEFSGLELFALVVTPSQPPPDAGYPVLLAAHGYHPDPPRYGIRANGDNRRPGDYYDGVPLAYAERGFLVVMPDYRGHNSSQGLKFTESALASTYYALDAAAAMRGIDSLDEVDQDNIFVWGHSMGGEIALRLLVTHSNIRAASLWAPSGGTVHERAHYYARPPTPKTESSQVPNEGLERLMAEVANTSPPYDPQANEPLDHLDRITAPLLLHHALDDPAVPYVWTTRLAAGLIRAEVRYRFYSYDNDQHMFRDESFQTAVGRDVQFFHQRMSPGAGE